MCTSASASSLHNGIPLEKGSCKENGYSELTPTANSTRSKEGANNGAPGGLAPPQYMAALDFVQLSQMQRRHLLFLLFFCSMQHTDEDIQEVLLRNSNTDFGYNQSRSIKLQEIHQQNLQSLHFHHCHPSKQKQQKTLQMEFLLENEWLWRMYVFSVKCCSQNLRLLGSIVAFPRISLMQNYCCMCSKCMANQCEKHTGAK